MVQTGSWTQKASMSGARHEVAAAVADDRLYVVGGGVSCSFTNRPGVRSLATQRNEVYDPATDRWLARMPLPEPRDHLAIAAIDKKIYVFGGFTHSVHQGAGTCAYEFDTEAGTWRTLASMSAPRASAGAAVIDGKIHVIGGRGLEQDVTFASHSVYDPAADRWSEAAPMARARDHMGVVAVDGKIHAIGGRIAGPETPVDWHEVYDPAVDAWSPALPLPTPRSNVATVLYKGMILVLGGELWVAGGQPYYCFVDNEGYDLAAEQWVKLKPLPAGRHAFAGGVIGESAYFAGGSLTPGGAGSTDQLILFTLGSSDA